MRTSATAHAQYAIRTVPDLDRSRYLQFLSERQVARARAALLTGQPTPDVQLKAARVAFRAALWAARRRTSDAVRLRLLNEVDRLAAEHMTATERLLSRRAAAPFELPSLGEAFQREVMPRRAALDRALVRLIDHDRARLAAANAASEREQLRATLWIVIASVVALGLAIAIAWTAVRSLRRARRREEDVLRAQAAALAHVRGLLDAMPIAVAELDRDLRFRFVNAAYEQWFEAPPEGVVGRSLREVVGRQEAIFVPASQAALAGRQTCVEAGLRCRDGVRHVRVTAVPHRDASGAISHILAVIADVTEERRTQERERFLDRATRELFAHLDYQTTLRTLVDLAVPTLANWAAVEMVQEDGSLEQVAMSHDDPSRLVLAGELRRRYPPRPGGDGVGEVIATGRPSLLPVVGQDDLAGRAVDDEHLDLLQRMDVGSAVIVPMKAHGSVLGAIALYASAASGRRYSRADLRFAEELARRAAIAIENARLFELTRRAVAAREELLAVVSHDLRSPLGVIRLKAQMMKERISAMEDQRGLNVDVIQRAADRMDSLVAALADATRLRAGRFTIERSSCDAVSLAREAILVMTPLAEEKRVRLELAAACDQALLYADRERVQQVLFNLLGNAIKFTPPDGVVGVEVVRHAPAAEIRIAVTDNGPGIPPDELPRIFERYWQGQPGRRGSGLGLYIAQGIVAAHGGRIWADSRLGEGSTFSFALPIAAEEIPLESEPAGSRTTWSDERTPTPLRTAASPP
ncbi:MAG TPA: ATP-binding protein, partial [Kofleriaceae bacterium]|nr:ATP-binding protein [Kofleriaceae bacterium]